MARVIETAKFVERDLDRSFDFEPFADGRIWELVDGEDFDVPARKFAARARNFAKRTKRGIRVATTTETIETIEGPEAGPEGERVASKFERSLVHLQFYELAVVVETDGELVAELPADHPDSIGTKPKSRKRR